jgi:hypothetical protein
MRPGQEQCVISLAPRLPGGLVGSLEAADPVGKLGEKLADVFLILPPEADKMVAFENILTGERLPVHVGSTGERRLEIGRFMKPLPVALLQGISADRLDLDDHATPRTAPSPPPPYR